MFDENIGLLRFQISTGNTIAIETQLFLYLQFRKMENIVHRVPDDTKLL